LYPVNENKGYASLWKVMKWILLVLILAWCVCLVTGYTAVVRLNDAKTAAPVAAVKSLKKGAILDILQSLNIDGEDWSAYLLVSKADMEKLPEGVPRRRVLRINDAVTLMSMRTSWRMRVGVADTKPPVSTLVITQNGKVRWESGIELGSKEGLQSQSFGRVEPLQPGIIQQSLRHFKPVYSPLVILW
jgi:hypothetical protein